MATIKQIAEFAGVSRGTVDRVINGRGHVNPDVEKRVQAIIEALDYKPSRAAQQLALRKQPLRLGILYPSANRQGIWQDVLCGIESAMKELEDYNITLFVKSFAYYYSDEVLTQLDALAAENLHGLAIVPMNAPKIKERLEQFTKNGTTVLFFNSEIDGFSPLTYIGSDYLSSGRVVAGLFDLMIGPQTFRPAIFYGSEYMKSQQLRIDGFCLEMGDLNRDLEIVGPALITNDPEVAYQTARHFIENHREINGIYTAGGHVDSVCHVLEDLNLSGKIPHISYDLSKNICDHLDKKNITVVIGQEGVRQGYQAVKILVDYLLFHIQPAGPRILTHNEIFVKQNKDLWQRQFR